MKSLGKTCRIDHPKYKEARKQMAELIANDDLNFIERLKNPNEYFKDYKLGRMSLLEKLAVLEDARQLASSGTTVLSLDNIKLLKQDVLDSVVYYYDRIIEDSEWVKSLLGLTEELKSTIFDITFAPSKFIPVFAPELNTVVFKLASGLFSTKTFWDILSKNIVNSPEKLAKALASFRTLLLLELSSAYSLGPVPHQLMDPAGFEKVYPEVLKKAWEQIKLKITEYGPFINVKASSLNIKDIINPIRNFYILLNFDKCVEAFSEGTITIRPELRNIMNYDSDKYIKVEQAIIPGSFSDNYTDIDASKNLPHLLKRFVTGIELSSGKTIDAKFIEKLSMGIRYIMDSVHDKKSQYLDILYSEEPLYNKIDRLATLIEKDDALKRRTSSEECVALANNLREYNKQLAQAATNGTSIKDLADQLNGYNIGELLLSTTNKSPMIYSTISSDGNIEIKTAVDKERSKASIAGGIENALTKTLLNGEKYRLLDSFLVNSNSTFNTFDDIYSLRLRKLFRDVTGISLASNSLLELLSEDENIQKAGLFFHALRKIVIKYFGTGLLIPSLADIKKYLPQVMKELKRNEYYILFTDLLINNNGSDILKLRDSSDNQMPVLGNNTTIANFSKNLYDFLKEYAQYSGANPSQNILLKYRGLTEITTGYAGDRDATSTYSGHIVNAVDANFDNGRAAKTVDLSVKEQAEIALNSDYIASIVDGGVMLNQIEAYSDKVRIAKGAWNFNNELLHELQIGTIDQEKDSLLKLSYLQHQSYYNTVERQIVSEMSGVLGLTNAASIEDIATALEKIPDEKTLTAKVAVYLKTHPNVSILRDVHYSILNGKLSINFNLYKKIREARDPKLFLRTYNQGLESFLNDVQKETPAIIFKRDLDTLDNNKLARIFALFGYNYNNLINQKEDFEKAKKNILEVLDTDTWAYEIIEENDRDKVAKLNRNKLKHDFLSKYFALASLTREADLLISLKHAWIHDKVATNLKNKSIEQISAAYDDIATNGDRASLNSLDIDKLLIAEYGKRLTKSKKRFNAGPASFEPWTKGSKYGLPNQIRIANIEGASREVINYFGKHEILSTHDGAIFSPSVTRWLERHSAGDRKVSQVLKDIFLMPHLSGFEQIKCADYEINNAFIRETLKNQSYNPEAFNGVEMLYKCLAPVTLTAKFIENWRKNTKDLGLKFSYTFLGRVADLLSINIDDSGNFNFDWVYRDTELKVDSQIVRKSLFTSPELLKEKSDTFKLRNLFDLWEAFGGAYCQDLLEDGSFDFTDNSLEVLALLMSEFDPSMKGMMIHKLVDENATKSSQGVKNYKDTFFDRSKTFATTSIDIDRYGIQLDYSHEAEGSKIPTLTLVLTAIAFNGENSQLVDNMYNVLADITRESLNNIISDWKLPEKRNKFHRWMARELLHKLSTNSVASNAEEIIQDVLQVLVKKGENAGYFTTVPYSNPQLFYLATSDLIAKLNSDVIHLKFEGMGVIQNPSNGIVGIYEDINGQTYTQTAIINLALEWASKQFDLQVYTQEDIVNAFLSQSPLFASEELTINNFNILGISDTVQFEGKKPQIIISPIELKEIFNRVANGEKCLKLHNQPRDLAVTKITWQDKNGGGNFWLLNSTLTLINNTLNNNNDDKTARLWQKANLKGLKDKVPYYYNTREDYIRDIKTYISGKVIWKGGEDVLPKHFLTKFNMKGKSMSWLKQHPEHFSNIVKKRYLLDPSITLKGQDLGFAADDYDVIITSDSVTESEVSRNIQNDNGVYHLVDERGLQLTNIILPNANFAYKIIPSIANQKAKIILYTKGIGNFNLDRFVAENKNWINNVFSNNSEIIKRFGNKAANFHIEELGLQLYQSFLATLHTISARIPSQSFLSFLANETVAFTEDESNNGYMNIWEMWFLGSK